MIAAIPVLIANGGLDFFVAMDYPGCRPEWNLAKNYQQQHGDACFTNFAIARSALLFVPLAGTVLIWQLGHRWFGDAIGWIPAVLWVFSPTVLAFGASITPDVPSAVAGLWCILLFWNWLEKSSWEQTVRFGFALSICLLCKFSWVILPPLLIAIWLIRIIYQKRRLPIRELMQWFVVSCIVIFVINACYGFQDIGKQLGKYDFVSQTLIGNKSTPPDIAAYGNRFRGTWLGSIPVPVPEDYALGIDIQKRDFELKMPSYFLGQWRDHGWIEYYAVAILLKEPIALWGLFTLTFFSAFRNKSLCWTVEKCVVIIPGIAIFVFVSLQTGFNHHLRYVLPFFPVLFLASVGTLRDSGRKIHLAAYALTMGYVVSSITILPRSYAFFTEAVGGATEGWRYLGDSNLDWGQDLMTLKRWLVNNPSSQDSYLLYSIDLVDAKLLDIKVQDGKRHQRRSNGNNLYPTVVGRWIVFSRPLMSPEGEWFRYRTPDLILSPTIRIYNVNERDLMPIESK